RRRLRSGRGPHHLRHDRRQGLDLQGRGLAPQVPPYPRVVVMLSPKRTKFRKQQKGRNRGIAWRGSDVSFGDFALQAVGRSWVTARQTEASRMAIQRHVKRAGNLFIRIFPDKPVTKKPLEVRMGSGKGSV